MQEPIENPKHIGEYFTPRIVLPELFKLYETYFKGYNILEPCCGSGRICNYFQTKFETQDLKPRVKGYDLYESNVMYCKSLGLDTSVSDYHAIDVSTLDKNTVIVTNPPFDIPVTKVYRKAAYIDIFNHFSDFNAILLLPIRSLKYIPIQNVRHLYLLPPHLFPARIMGNTGIFVLTKEQYSTLQITYVTSPTPGINNSYFRKLELPAVDTWNPWTTNTIEYPKEMLFQNNFNTLPILRNYSVLPMCLNICKTVFQNKFPKLGLRYKILPQNYFTDSVDFVFKPVSEITENEIIIVVSRLVWNRNPMSKLMVHNHDTIHRFVINKSKVKKSSIMQNTDILTREAKTKHQCNHRYILVVSACNESWNGFYKPIEAEQLQPNTIYSRSYIGIQCESQDQLVKLKTWITSKVFSCIVSMFKHNQNFKSVLQNMPDLSTDLKLVDELNTRVQTWPEETRHEYNKSCLVTFQQCFYTNV